MRRCVWSWKSLDTRIYTQPASARSLYRQRACLTMWMPGELGDNTINIYIYRNTDSFYCCSCRWVPTLNPNDVADRVITAIRKNEKLAVIPGFLKALLSFKWYVLSCGNTPNDTKFCKCRLWKGIEKCSEIWLDECNWFIYMGDISLLS